MFDNVCVPDSVTYPESDGISAVNATVPLSFLNVIVRSSVGSVN